MLKLKPNITINPHMEQFKKRQNGEHIETLDIKDGVTLSIDFNYTNPYLSKESIQNGIKELFTKVIKESILKNTPIQHKNGYLLNIAIKEELSQNLIFMGDEGTKSDIYRSNFMYILDDTTYQSAKEALANKGKHIVDYKQRGGEGGGIIELYGITPDEIEENKEYLDIYDEGQKYLVYYLGTLVHEIAHKVDKEYLEEYTTICKESENNITNYVKKHKKLYNTSEPGVIREDFAEGLRLYVTNYDYLEKISPQRAQFFDTHLRENFEKDGLKHM